MSATAKGGDSTTLEPWGHKLKPHLLTVFALSWPQTKIFQIYFRQMPDNLPPSPHLLLDAFWTQLLVG